LTATNEGDLYYAGAANILDMPEFYDYDLTHRLFEVLDQFDFWWGIVGRRDDPIEIIVGEELGPRGLLTQCGFVYHKFSSPHLTGVIGIVGPSRLNYSYVIPVVHYMGDLIGELSSNW